MGAGVGEVVGGDPLLAPPALAARWRREMGVFN